MPILLDGNNLLHRLPATSRTRSAVRALTLDVTRHERMSVTVVFDGPAPRGGPAKEPLGRVLVIYSGATPADEVIIRRIPLGPAARQWVVVTDDRQLAERARQRGASTRTLRDWTARTRPDPPRPRTESKLSSREVAEWERFFDTHHEEER